VRLLRAQFSGKEESGVSFSEAERSIEVEVLGGGAVLILDSDKEVWKRGLNGESGLEVGTMSILPSDNLAM